MGFKEKIKERRLALGLTTDELARLVGVSNATISRWETGAIVNQRRDKLELLARALNTTTAELMSGQSAETAPVSPADAAHYGELMEIDDALNPDGHKEFVRYGRYLTAQPEYKQKKPRRYTPEPVYIRHYLTPAAAGYASPVEGEDYELEEVTASVPPGADFSIDIDGDSMEPYIKNKSRVYVKRDSTIREFEDAGVFYYDGNVYCKQYCIDFTGALLLLSANPKRETANLRIPKEAAPNLICFGKVLLPQKLPRPRYG